MAYRARVKSLNVPRSHRKDEAEVFRNQVCCSPLFTALCVCVCVCVLLFAIDRNNSKA